MPIIITRSPTGATASTASTAGPAANAIANTAAASTTGAAAASTQQPPMAPVVAWGEVVAKAGEQGRGKDVVVLGRC